MSAKVFLGELWRLRLFSERHQEYWKERTKNLSKFATCHHVLEFQASYIQLHIFSDAPEVEYGTVAYLRFIFKTKKPHCLFAMTNTRLAPMKTISLSRLELNAAVLGVRLYKMIIKEVDLLIQTIKSWTDSVLVLQHIRNETHRFKVYRN